MKRKLSVLITLALITSALFYMRPIEIRKNYQGFLTPLDEEGGQQVQIFLEGRLNRRILSRDFFAGVVSVEDISRNIEMTTGTIHGRPFSKGKFVALISERGNEGEYTTNGVVMTSRNFDMIYVDLVGVNERYQGKFIAYGPANNRQEARQINLRLGEYK